ncbi:hypothetical protein [Nitrosarchaeum sp. AC2]|uniref:hypothetical protein n=1 Tax=Nitrosarchaeum sp. AC2 TaxID=2259673 RepID=UPI0015C9C8EE|nr:hypothetical protein [Nitrosarchaeum sp. AC2]QLH11264.1 hypothetical protein DSQ20_07170 [Nitrosarchaeum sp. AC2]
MSNSNSNQKPIELKDVYDILTDIRDAIKDSSKWAKFTGMKEIKPVLEAQLPNDSKKIIYHLSDSTKGTQEIAKLVGGISHMSISNYWKSWEKFGLGESVTVMGGKRFKRSFDIEDFGINVPELPKRVEQSTPQSKQDEQSTTEAESHD